MIVFIFKHAFGRKLGTLKWRQSKLINVRMNFEKVRFIDNTFYIKKNVIFIDQYTLYYQNTWNIIHGAWTGDESKEPKLLGNSCNDSESRFWRYQMFM